MTCPACKGTGKVSVKEDCPACDGTGEINIVPLAMEQGRSTSPTTMDRSARSSALRAGELVRSRMKIPALCVGERAKSDRSVDVPGES